MTNSYTEISFDLQRFPLLRGTVESASKEAIKS